MSKDVGELARFVLSRSDHTHPKENDQRKHRRSSAALECAARLAKAVFDLIQIAAPEIRLELLRGVPSYDGRLAIAYKSTWDVRKLAVQRMRGQHSRSHAHRIGPDVWDSAKRLRPDLKVPEHLGSARLPRTLNGWVEDILRDV